MAVYVANNPIRQSPHLEMPLLIQNVDELGNSQSTCNLFSGSQDATLDVLNSTLLDKFGNFNLAGLATFVRAGSTCKYAKFVNKFVKSPIDATVVDISYQVPGDQNLNSQRFVIHALRNSYGGPAGARFRLKGVGDSDESEASFLLAFRDCRNDSDRPVTIAIAKQTPNGSLLCVELSLKEMLIFFGGHSKKSIFASAKSPPLGLAKWQFNHFADKTSISVWGNSSSYLGLVDENLLEDDTLNPVMITAAPIMGSEFVMSSDQRSLDIDVKFNFYSSHNCAAFSDAKFSLIDPLPVSIFFGCFEKSSNACVPSSHGEGAMIPNAIRLVQPLKRSAKRKSSSETSKITSANIINGRRAAVTRCDLAIQRQILEDSMMKRGRYTPSHPLYARIKEELDSENERRAALRLPPLSDDRLCDSPPERAEEFVQIL